MKQLALPASNLQFSHILVSIAAAAICFQTALLLDWIFIPAWFYLLMFSNTYLLYGLQHLYGKKVTTSDEPKPGFFLSHRPYFIFFTGLSLLVSGILCFKLSWLQFSWLLAMDLLAVGYIFRLHLFKSPGRFKNNGVFTLLVLVLILTISTTVIPATFIPYGFDTKFWWLLLCRFFYILAICIPFDIRDDMGDINTKRKTMISLFGEKKCYRFSYAALAIASLCLFPATISGISIRNAMALLISFLLIGRVVHYCSRNPFSSNSYFMLNGSIILQTMLICIAVLIP